MSDILTKMTNSCPTTAPVPQQTLGNEINELLMDSHTLHERIDVVIDRMSSVLSPEAPASPNKALEGCSNVPLIATVQEIRSICTSQIDRIEALINRIQL